MRWRQPKAKAEAKEGEGGEGEETARGVIVGTRGLPLQLPLSTEIFVPNISFMPNIYLLLCSDGVIIQ